MTKNNNSKILIELSKLQYEKQYKSIQDETIKILEQSQEIQDKLDNLSSCVKSQQFNELPNEIKILAKENIYDEKRYYKDKKNENLNKLCSLHIDKVNLLHEK